MRVIVPVADFVIVRRLGSQPGLRYGRITFLVVYYASERIV